MQSFDMTRALTLEEIKAMPNGAFVRENAGEDFYYLEDGILYGRYRKIVLNELLEKKPQLYKLPSDSNWFIFSKVKSVKMMEDIKYLKYGAYLVDNQREVEIRPAVQLIMDYDYESIRGTYANNAEEIIISRNGQYVKAIQVCALMYEDRTLFGVKVGSSNTIFNYVPVSAELALNSDILAMVNAMRERFSTDRAGLEKRINDNFGMLVAAQRQLEALINQEKGNDYFKTLSDNLATQVEKLKLNAKVEDVRLNNNVLEIKTKPLAIKYFKNFDGDWDWANGDDPVEDFQSNLPIGSFTITYDLANSRLRARANEGLDYPTDHPHINEGEVCLGNVSDVILKNFKEFRVAEVFDVLITVLETYNDSSPYIGIEDFTNMGQEDFLETYQPKND